jgi:ureidoacrylate peracid hydrolase
MSDITLDPKETAFVFIEYQNEFTTEGGKLHPAVKEVMEKTNSEWRAYVCSA